MDYQSQNQYIPNGMYPNQPIDTEGSLSRMSRTMGIIAIISSFFGIGFIFGTLAIIFAIISKDKNNHLTKNGKWGVFLGTISIVFCIMLYIYIFVDPTMRGMLNETCQAIYGITFDEMIQQALNGQVPALNHLSVNPFNKLFHE